MADRHHWTFFRAGGFDQVKLETGADLLNLGSLDQTLWVALACPTGGLEIDSRTLQMIDTDKNGRVRAGELIAAVKFAAGSLKNPDDLLKGDSTLPLSAIDEGKPEGKVLIASARQILSNIGKKDAAAIAIEDVADTARIFADTAFNGDGLITEQSASDEPARAVIREILDCLGGGTDLSGKPGIGADKVETFFAEVKAFADWYALGDADAANVFPLGREGTAAAVAAIDALKAKIDDYFGRCRLAAYDPRTEAILNRKEEEYLDIAAKDLSISAAEVAAFPLARVGAGRPLPLSGAVNPAHAAALRTLSEAAVTPLLGERKEITESDWLALLAKVDPYRAWEKKKADLHIEKLGRARILELQSSGMRSALDALIEKDKALADATAGIEQVERLVRYYRDLAVLCTNFVNFKDFYDKGSPAIFQAGTLYLDQRACHLCMRVDDPAKHAAMAGLAGAYLAYLDCTRKGAEGKMQIVAAFTAGDSDNLMVGRNGIFYDRQGNDWDATIVKIVDNPISLRQAFWSPYKKFVRYLEEQVNKRAAAADAEANTALATTATTAIHIDKTAPPAAPKKMDVGTVAAIGVAAGAIGTFVTALIGYLSGILRLGLLPTLGAIAGIILLISMPSLVMAYIKLRKRNLGPILDANGWAVNTRARINVPFGATLSRQARLPSGSRRDSSDPYAEKSFPWKTLLLLGVLAYAAYRWYEGSLDPMLPQAARSTEILGKWAPRTHPVPKEIKTPVLELKP
jgi:hypothetical protein